MNERCTDISQARRRYQRWFNSLCIGSRNGVKFVNPWVILGCYVTIIVLLIAAMSRFGKPK